MVAFTQTIEHFVPNAPRARGLSRTFSNSAPTSTKPNPRLNFRRSTSQSNAPLGSYSRDPIGYVDGQSLHIPYFVLKGTDPTGLAAIVGHNNGYPIWQWEPGDSPAPPGPNACYTGSQYGPVWQPCPPVPPDMPSGPGYSGGLEGLWQANQFLNDVCGKCCKKCNCAAEARAISAALMQAWIDFYGTGRYRGGDSCGGFMCYHWTTIFSAYLSSVMPTGCFNFEVFAAKKAPPGQGGEVITHFFIRIRAGDGSDACSTWIDDGYETGHTSHTGFPFTDPNEWTHHMPPHTVTPLEPQIDPYTFPKSRGKPKRRAPPLPRGPLF